MIEPIIDREFSSRIGLPISKLRVCRSAAGYYIGRMVKVDKGVWLPYSRESEYYLLERYAEESLRLRTMPVLSTLEV